MTTEDSLADLSNRNLKDLNLAFGRLTELLASRDSDFETNSVLESEDESVSIDSVYQGAVIIYTYWIGKDVRSKVRAVKLALELKDEIEAQMKGREH